MIVKAAAENPVVVRTNGYAVDDILGFGFYFNRVSSPLVVEGFSCRPEKHPTIVTARNEPRSVVRKL